MLALMDHSEPLISSDEEALIAREAVARLRPVAEANQNIRLRVMDSPDIVVPLPARALALIFDVLEAMAERKPVSFMPYEAELTTQQAADFLNVSRPHLVGLLEKGDLPFRKVGAHRRVRVCDVIEYKAKSEAVRRGAIRDMVAVSQELGLE